MVRPPERYRPGKGSEDALTGFWNEVAGEKAAALGRAGRQMEVALRTLADNADDQRRDDLLFDAAEAVQAYFIQRELIGLRNHRSVIEDYAIPKAVLVRVGASRRRPSE